MNIEIEKNWKIRSDKLNVILCRLEDERWVNEGYFQTLEGCLDSFIQKKIKASAATSMPELISELKALQTRLNTIVQPLKMRVVEA